MGIYEMMKQRMEAQEQQRQGEASCSASAFQPSSAVQSAAGLVKQRIPTQANMPDTSGDFWTVDAAVVKDLMTAVCQSPHVQENSKYGSLVARLQFKLIEQSIMRPKELGGLLDEAEVNAYARVDPLEGFPTICLYAGAVRYARLMAASYVATKHYVDAVPFPQAISSMVAMFMRNGMRLTSELAAVFASENGLTRVLLEKDPFAESLMLANGTIIGVLAHEFGHLVLGHCEGHSCNDEVSQNHEREADSFASSVVSTSAYKDVIGIGTIIWELALVVTEKIVQETPTSHPPSAERLMNFIRANPSASREIGFDKIRELLSIVGIALG